MSHAEATIEAPNAVDWVIRDGVVDSVVLPHLADMNVIPPTDESIATSIEVGKQLGVLINKSRLSYDDLRAVKYRILGHFGVETLLTNTNYHTLIAVAGEVDAALNFKYVKTEYSVGVDG